MYTVDDMYSYCKENNIKLLSEFNANFWTYYIQNSSYFDSLFRKRYMHFVYFNQDYEDDKELSDVTTEFIDSVYEWLLANKKRYEELFRPLELSDSEYHILNDYDITTNHSGSDTHAGSFIAGQRTDVNINNIGDQEYENLNKVTAFNANNENSKDSNKSVTGSREDITQFTKGQQNNTDASLDTNSFNERSFYVI